MNKIAKYLNQHLVGNVFDRPEILEKYSTDRSILKITPKMVVIPENVNDVRRTVRFVNQLAAKGYALKLATRGSGLDKTGADLSPDLVLSTEKLNHIQELDERSRLVRVQAGVTLGDLNSSLALMGLTVPVDVNPHATLGSLVSNCAKGRKAGKYDDFCSRIESIEVVLSSGDILQTGRISKRLLNQKQGLTSSEGAVYRDLAGLIEDNFDIVSDLKNVPFVDDAGYQRIVDVYREKGSTFDLTPLFFGAQGTLGIITEVILRCEPLSYDVVRFVAAFGTAEKALDYADQISTLEPSVLDFYDARIFAESAAAGKDPKLFSAKFHDGYILSVAFDDRPRKNRKKIAKCLKFLPKSAAAVVEAPENAADFNRIETAFASFLNDDLRGERAPVIDDFYVPADQFATFLEEVRDSEETYGVKLPLFGSYATGIYSIRPDLRLNSVEGRQIALKLIKDFSRILVEHGGSLTGGGPEGRTKAIAVDFTENELALYEKIKEIFDPHSTFNPDVKLGSSLKSVVKNLRTVYLDDIVS